MCRTYSKHILKSIIIMEFCVVRVHKYFWITFSRVVHAPDLGFCPNSVNFEARLDAPIMVFDRFEGQESTYLEEYIVPVYSNVTQLHLGDELRPSEVGGEICNSAQIWSKMNQQIMTKCAPKLSCEIEFPVLECQNELRRLESCESHEYPMPRSTKYTLRNPLGCLDPFGDLDHRIWPELNAPVIHIFRSLL